MTHKFKVTGMTCNKCVEKVQKTLSKINGVENVNVTLDPPEAEIRMRHHIDESTFNSALQNIGDYKLGDEVSSDHNSTFLESQEEVSKLKTYKPLILVFIYILLCVTLLEINSGSFKWMSAMNHFMAGFFITFSFFKMLDLTNFASSYSSYDVISKKWYGYGFVYPFIELTLGVLYLLQAYPLFTNIATIVVMSISSIGVIQSIMNKRQIQCACLGTVFNLPMSTITLIEDLLMVVMALIMLLVM
ncbi:MAG: cation transporter [Ignavibacteria bacterium]|nr:cation transporter [Ignavibacteria bacterium]